MARIKKWIFNLRCSATYVSIRCRVDYKDIPSVHSTLNLSLIGNYIYLNNIFSVPDRILTRCLLGFVWHNTVTTKEMRNYEIKENFSYKRRKTGGWIVIL